MDATLTTTLSAVYCVDSLFFPNDPILNQEDHEAFAQHEGHLTVWVRCKVHRS